MAIQLGIHVTPDSNPENIGAMIRELYKTQKTFINKSVLLDYLKSVGIGSRSEITAMASDLGVIGEVSNNIIGLSSKGIILAQVREEAFNDLLHYLIYTGWSSDKPRHFLQSWAYRQCSDRYWELESIKLTPDFLNQQVGEISNQVDLVFPELGITDYEGVAFSRKSLTGVHKWLEVLDPPVLNNKSYSRRMFCQPELVIMALAYALRNDPHIHETDVLLSPEIRDDICRVTHLEPNSLDQALDWALPAYPELVAPGTTAGFYGRFIRVRRLPQLEDIIR